MGDRRFDGWKSIANYMGRGVRTVQRWERNNGLPVHRIPRANQHQRGTVYSFESELKDWLSSQPLRNDGRPPKGRKWWPF